MNGGHGRATKRHHRGAHLGKVEEARSSQDGGGNAAAREGPEQRRGLRVEAVEHTDLPRIGARVEL